MNTKQSFLLLEQCERLLDNDGSLITSTIEHATPEQQELLISAKHNINEARKCLRRILTGGWSDRVNP